MMNSPVENSFVKWHTKINIFIIVVVLLSIYMPIIGMQLYFRHDDSQTLLWAKEFTGNIFYAFNPKPWLNEYFQYPGVGGYYRPFESIFIMGLLKIFGPKAIYFQFINGLLVIGTILFMYKIAEIFSNKIAALLSVSIFHLCFHSMLYGTFHVVVPFGYFFELGCFYFTARGLFRNDKKSLMLALFFLIPATNRQTTVIILPAIIIVYLVSFWHQTFPGSKIKFAIPIIAMIPNLMLPFSSHSSNATILNLDSNLMGKFNFIFERILFYGSLLTRGMTGFIILFCLLGFLLIRILGTQGFFKKLLFKKQYLLLIGLPILCGLMTIVVMKLNILAIVVFFLVMIYVLIIHKNLRYAGMWFFVSLGCFLSILMYHNAYLLEAAYGLSVVLGIVLFKCVNTIVHSFNLKRFYHRNFKKLIVIGIIGMVTFCIVFTNTRYDALFFRKFEAVQVLIQTNKNFKDLIYYIKNELPLNAKIYELSIDDLGIRFETWRFWSLKEKAEKIKVMEIIDTVAMLKVLDRYDLSLESVSRFDNSECEMPCYFIACNKFEKDIAEKKYDLHVIRRFQRGNTEAVLYRIIKKRNI